MNVKTNLLFILKSIHGINVYNIQCTNIKILITVYNRTCYLN